MWDDVEGFIRPVEEYPHVLQFYLKRGGNIVTVRVPKHQLEQFPELYGYVLDSMTKHLQ